MYNVIKAFGLLEFAKNRYGSLENNLAKWDKSLPNDENINKNLVVWGYVPGLPNEEGVDYSNDFAGVPEANMKRVLEAEQFVRYWCSKKNYEKKEEKQEGAEDNVEEGEVTGVSGLHVPVPPKVWETAYDMRPWPDFPDRKQR
jgi:hypothetical protein